MVRDAEEHAEEDKKARELADARNQAEAIAHGTRKQLDEVGDKVNAEEKSKVENALSELDESIKGEDIEDIQSKIQTVTEVSGPLFAQAAQQGSEPGDSEKSNSDDVVDAEFEEVDDDKKKS